MDMEHSKVHLEDMEKASNAYIMSLIAVVIGLPMPIINLIATGIFFMMSRKGSHFVKWHTTQALISQIPLFVLNNILFWWTVRILLFGAPLSSLYISYFLLVNIYNIVDFYATAVSAVKARKGITYRWFMYGPLTDLIMKRRTLEAGEKRGLFNKMTMQCIISGMIFICSLFFMNTMDWMRICRLQPNSVEKWTETAIWKITSLRLHQITSPELVAPIDSIANRLCLANGIDTASIEIHLCRSHEVNAYAMAGRRILVNTALVETCHNEQELAGILAHELAHIQCGHIRQSTQIQLLAIIIETFLGGGNAQTAGGDITSIATTLTTNYFSRDKETEADTRAVEYMTQAGMNPEALGDFLERMETIQLLEFLSTHPDSRKRAEHIRLLAKEHEVPYTDTLSPDTWNKLKDKL